MLVLFILNKKFYKSDGWCVQGNCGITWSGNPIVQINLIKSYTNTNYLLFTQDFGTVADADTNGITITMKNLSYFKIQPYTNNRQMNWIAFGNT